MSTCAVHGTTDSPIAPHTVGPDRLIPVQVCAATYVPTLGSLIY